MTKAHPLQTLLHALLGASGLATYRAELQQTDAQTKAKAKAAREKLSPGEVPPWAQLTRERAKATEAVAGLSTASTILQRTSAKAPVSSREDTGRER